MATDYEQFYVIGSGLTGFRLECWVCDGVLPWEDPDGCLSLGEMARVADAHWVEHPDGVAPEQPAPDTGPTPVFRIPMRRPTFTGILGFLADRGGEQR